MDENRAGPFAARTHLSQQDVAQAAADQDGKPIVRSADTYLNFSPSF